MDNKCYVCTKDILKKYICKDCYFSLLREKERLENALKVIAKFQYVTASKDALLLSGWAEQALEANK
ncbi:MAG: hypothetical protein J7L43_02050 [Candidatus Aenigmarchaeota archaeon]|nr:hypothetical protein [Candidatus Aenigmarchaeota archaeon]